MREGQIRTASNHHGGVLGGITSGMPLIFRVAVKPTPSIARKQRSVDMATLSETTLAIQGRHDPCIAPRAVPCVEAATALALLDMMLEQGKI
jgi:chorismate synthase